MRLLLQGREPVKAGFKSSRDALGARDAKCVKIIFSLGFDSDAPWSEGVIKSGYLAY